MENNSPVEKGENPSIPDLSLPLDFHSGSYQSALEIDEVIKQTGQVMGGDGLNDSLRSKLDAYRETSISHLTTLRGKISSNVDRLRWPQSLFIPEDADYRNYWVTPPPDDHRYSHDWTSPTSTAATTASCKVGSMFTYTTIDQSQAGKGKSSESGVGVLYKPAMNLGVVDVQPVVDCSGTLRTMMDFNDQLLAGYVEVKAQLLLAAWQPIYNGYDLLGYRVFEVSNSGRRDQSFGPEMLDFHKSYDGPELSAPFVVQAGRTVLFGVVSRVIVVSTLTKGAGVEIRPISSTVMRVWGSMTSLVSQINVNIRRIDIP